MRRRSLKVVLVVVGILLGTLGVAAFMSHEQDVLPFEYDGFD